MPEPVITAPAAPAAPAPAPAPVAPAAPAAPAGSDSWVTGIPEGPARDIVVAKGYKEPADLAGAYYNLTRIHTGSGDVIEKPAADATPEQLDTFYKSVNNPPETYDFKLPEGAQADQTFMEVAKGWFKDAGLRGDQAQKLVDANLKYGAELAAKQQAEATAKRETEIAQLRSKYEATGDKTAFDAVIANGQKAARALGLDKAFLDRLDDANGPAANIELLALIGEKIGGEASFHDGAPSGGAASSPEAARVELAKLAADKAFVDSLLDMKNPMHAVNNRKHAELQKVAYGQKR